MARIEKVIFGTCNQKSVMRHPPREETKQYEVYFNFDVNNIQDYFSIRVRETFFVDNQNLNREFAYLSLRSTYYNNPRL